MDTADFVFMDRAIELADRGRGAVNPNPLVGAVIVKDGRVIGEGWHRCYGGPHAERNALADCKEDPEGATMYVTLEPCCHYGKTPPCTEAIISNRIARVVIGIEDPNPVVSGKGAGILRDAGIEVVCGVREDRIREQNRIFLKYITSGKPWVVMKTAMTIDGKIASPDGDSNWVTGPQAREMVHSLRSGLMAVMVGRGTVEADDPMLNCRLGDCARQPVRIVVDSGAAISEDSALVRTAGEYPLLVAYASGASEEKIGRLESLGAGTVCCASDGEGRVDVGDMLSRIGKKGIDSVLLEGGGELNSAFISNRLVDEVYAFVAPKIIGGRDAVTPVEGDGISRMKDAFNLCGVTVETVGRDILIRGMLDYDHKENIGN